MCKTDDITCVAGVRKGRGREFECETAREGEGRRGTRSLPPSLRAPSHFSRPLNLLFLPFQTPTTCAG